MMLIVLSNGSLTKVDDEDFFTLNQYQWYTISGYAVTRIGGHLDRTEVFMHNLIMPPPSGFKVDHKDRDKLNNQRSNLRFATNSQNMQNAVHPHNTSGYRGVAFYKGKWCAQIMKDGQLHYLGRHVEKADAAHAYDLKAIELFGPGAYLNFPQEREVLVQFVAEQNALATIS